MKTRKPRSAKTPIKDIRASYPVDETQCTEHYHTKACLKPIVASKHVVGVGSTYDPHGHENERVDKAKVNRTKERNVHA